MHREAGSSPALRMLMTARSFHWDAQTDLMACQAASQSSPSNAGRPAAAQNLILVRFSEEKYLFVVRISELLGLLLVIRPALEDLQQHSSGILSKNFSQQQNYTSRNDPWHGP